MGEPLAELADGGWIEREHPPAQSQGPRQRANWRNLPGKGVKCLRQRRTVFEHRENALDVTEPLGDVRDVVQHTFAATKADQPIVGEDDARTTARECFIGSVDWRSRVYTCR